jgi:hypothetical protein
MTAVANTAFTAAQFNLHVRDNLNETAPAKASAAGRLIVTTGANSIAERLVDGNNVFTSETTGTTSYTDLATVGPSVPGAPTGDRAIVFITAEMSNNTLGSSCFAGVDVSGASTIAANDTACLKYESSAANDRIRATAAVHFDGSLTPGTHTFTLKYKVDGGTGTFLNRNICVIAL